LAGDVSIQYQTRRDLLDEHRPELRARIAAEGWGARYLACCKRDGSWPLQAAHPGQVHFEMEPTGQPSRWNTLLALRVLRFYGIS